MNTDRSLAANGEQATQTPPGLRGFSLIELMIAVTAALFLTLVIVGVMSSISGSAKVQNGTSRLQENARHALRTMARDLRRAGSTYCLNYAANDGAMAAGGVAHVDQRRAVLSLFDATGAPYRLGSFASAPTAPYHVDPAELVLGSECASTGSTCSPDPAALHALSASGDQLPPVGYPPVAGNRARGADVLSFRYLDGPGAPIISIENTEAEAAGVQQVEIELATPGPLPAISRILATDCASSFVAAVTSAGSTLTLSGTNFDGGDTSPQLNAAAARVFNLDTDLRTVSYFLRIDANPDGGATPLISNLVRRINGVDEVVAQGIERLDFEYHVELPTGTTRVLDANGVSALAAAQCRGLATPVGATVSPAPCGWRSLKGIEVVLLANTIDTATGSEEAFRYSWRVDGTQNLTGEYERPATLPNGLPPGRLLRREFRTYVALRGMNP